MRGFWRWLLIGILLAAFFGNGVAGSASIISWTIGLFLACAVVGWLLRLDTKHESHRQLPDNVVPLRRVK